ncbi:hypothetical protein [Anatilimnocola floriformis]|nr:hypothetical protein [Anatilimnocola floriformis]
MDRKAELFEIVRQALAIGESDLSLDDYRELLEECAIDVELRIQAMID